MLCIFEGFEMRTICRFEMPSDLHLGKPGLHAGKPANEWTQHRRRATGDSSIDYTAIYSVQSVFEILLVSAYEHESVATR